MPISDNAKARFRAVTSVRTERCYSIREVAQILACSEDTVYRRVSSGDLTATRVGKRSARVLGASLQAFIERNLIEPDRPVVR
jgi:excisionase family DNA binding protein